MEDEIENGRGRGEVKKGPGVEWEERAPRPRRKSVLPGRRKDLQEEQGGREGNGGDVASGFHLRKQA